MTYNQNEMDCQKPKIFEYDFSSNGLNKSIEIPLPLPQQIDEWGVATLVLRVKISQLVILLKLLLLERSVLIIGDR